MHKAGTERWEFAWEFERCTQDVGMAKEGTKIHLVSALNQDTISCLDAYVTMCGGNKMAYLETVQDRLHCIPYVQMLVYLK